MFHKVLVPFDIRFIPKNALHAAAALAHAGAELTLLYVADVAADFAHAAFTPISQEEVDSYGARVNQKIDNVLALLAEFGATASVYSVRKSPIHTAINEVAKAMMADVVVMGTHGRRGLSRLWNGSVTECVIRDADVPVMVIRESSRKPFFPRIPGAATPPLG